MFLATSGVPMSDRSDFSIVWDTIGLIVLTAGGIGIGVLLLSHILEKASETKWTKNNEHRKVPCPPQPSDRLWFPLFLFGGLLTLFALLVLFIPNDDLVQKHNINLATEHYGVTLNDGYKKKEGTIAIAFPEPGRFIPLGSITLDTDQQTLIKTAYLERSEDDILTISTTGEDGITLIPLPVQN